MRCRRLSSSAAVALAIAGLGTAAAQAPDTTRASLRPGQKLYVVAVRENGRPDFELERRATKAIEKKKVLGIAPKLSQADFVLVMYPEYSRPESDGSEYLINLNGLLVPSTKYLNDRDDRDRLREDAVWQERVKPGLFRSIPEGLSGKLIGKLHETMPRDSVP